MATSHKLRAERAALDRCGLFRPLSDSEREALFARARTHKYAANENIFLMGSPGDDMVAVVSGTIRISVPSPDGKEIVLAILGPGEICGEIALLDGKERTADASAVTDCSVVVLERRDVLAFLAQIPRRVAEIDRRALRAHARRRSADGRVRDGTFARAPRQGLAAIGEPRRAHAPDGRAIECIHLTQRELGNVIGATRESVNKHLRAWQRKGCVRIADRLIVITNRAGLEDLTVPEG